MSGNVWLRSTNDDYWFKVGRVGVTSTIIAVFIGALGLLGSVVSGTGVVQALAYIPRIALQGGEFWRLVSWPLADTIGLWPVLNLVMLWYFGRDLESYIGRRKMGVLLLGIAGALLIATTIVGLTLGSAGLAGLSMVEFAVLLLWIAEWPTRRFLFNIPAWAFGAFLLGLQVLSMIMMRAGGSLLVLLISLALTAVLARGVGLLSNYRWVPGGAVAARPDKQQRTARKQAARQADDAQRMDELLAKISQNGLHSLSKSERAELDRLRERRHR